MSAISFNKIPGPEQLRDPGPKFEISNENAGSFSQNTRFLIVGQMVTAGGGAGTATPDQLVRYASADEAGVLTGRRSMSAAMARIVEKNDDFLERWLLPIADNPAGQPSIWTDTITGPATASGTRTLYVGADSVQYKVTNGDSADTMAAACHAAISAHPDLQVTSSVLGAVVTLTSVHAGEATKDLLIQYDVRGPFGGERPVAGVTETIVQTQAGTANPDTTNALAVTGDEEFDIAIFAYSDSANLDQVDLVWDDDTGKWKWGRHVYGHVFVARAGTYGELGTFGDTRNGPAGSCMGMQGCPNPPWEIAAALSSSIAQQLAKRPTADLGGTHMKGLLAPREEDRFDSGQRNALNFDGISTYEVDKAGAVRVKNVITLNQKNEFGQPDDSYLFVNTRFALMRYVRQRNQAFTQKFKGYSVADDGEYETGEKVITPKQFAAWMLSQYKLSASDHLVRRDFDEYLERIRVVRSGVNRLDTLDWPVFLGPFQIGAFKIAFQF